MSREEINEKIDNYLKGKLSSEEALAFEQEIADNPDLAEEVEMYRMEHEVMNELIREDLFAQMDQWDEELEEEEEAPATPVRRLWPTRRILSIAAAVAVLIVASVWLINRTGPQEMVVADSSATIKESMRIPLIESGGDGLGLSGERAGAESVTVFLMQDSLHAFHYRFKDDLQLFIPQDKGELQEMRLQYDPGTDTYQLFFNDRQFTLEKGFNSIYELKEKE